MNGLSSTLTIAANGLNTASANLAKTAVDIANYGAIGGATSATVPPQDRLVQDVVDLDNARISFKANALVLKTTDKLLGNLLDVFDSKPRR